MSRPRPRPPYPDLVRTTRKGFGWLDRCLLGQGWLASIGPDALAVLALLALAADPYGASYYGRLRMAATLGIDCQRVDAALARLIELGLVAFRSWRPGLNDGVWQLLPMQPEVARRSNEPRSLRDLLADRGATQLPTPPENAAE